MRKSADVSVDEMPHDSHRDPIRGLAKWMRLRRKPGTSAVLDAIAPKHDELVALERPADMRRNDLGGELVHWLATKNLSIQLGLRAVMVHASPEIQGHPIAERHIAQNALDIPRLRSDLATNITDPHSGEIISPSLSPSRIDAIPALQFPAIENLADLAAFDIVLSGSNIGIGAQFRRQRKVLKLSAEAGGGAEFLGGREAAWKAGAKVLFGRAESEELISTAEAKMAACETGVQIITIIIDGMQDPDP